MWEMVIILVHAFRLCSERRGEGNFRAWSWCGRMRNRRVAIRTLRIGVDNDKT